MAAIPGEALFEGLGRLVEIGREHGVSPRDAAIEFRHYITVCLDSSAAFDRRLWEDPNLAEAYAWNVGRYEGPCGALREEG